MRDCVAPARTRLSQSDMAPSFNSLREASSCLAHRPLRLKSAVVDAFMRALRELNPRPRFWRPLLCHLTKRPETVSNYSKALDEKLLFRFLMNRMLFTPPAMLLKFNLTLNAFSILSAPIVDPFAIMTCQFY